MVIFILKVTLNMVVFLTLDSKWYSKPSSQIGLHFAGLPQERSEDVSKKMVGKSFSKKLFEIALKLQIPDRALETKFIRGMTDGILSPTEYGGYMVQDIAYLAHVAKTFKEGARKLEEQENNDLALTFFKRAERYDQDYQQSLKTWGLESDACVKTGPAAQMYMGYTWEVMQSDPKNLLIATLPCSMLWAWIAGQRIGSARLNERNPYLPWFNENERQPGEQGTTEKLVDVHFTEEEEGRSIHIFCEGVMMEVNMFREAGGEELFASLNEICRF